MYAYYHSITLLYCAITTPRAVISCYASQSVMSLGPEFGFSSSNSSSSSSFIQPGDLNAITNISEEVSISKIAKAKCNIYQERRVEPWEKP